MDSKSFPFELSLFTAFVLRVILAEPEEHHYAARIFRDLELEKDAPYTFGTEAAVQSILKKLANAGWLTEIPDETDPKVTGKPRRTYYKITAVGQLEGGRYIAIVRDCMS